MRTYTSIHLEGAPLCALQLFRTSDGVHGFKLGSEGDVGYISAFVSEDQLRTIAAEMNAYLGKITPTPELEPEQFFQVGDVVRYVFEHDQTHLPKFGALGIVKPSTTEDSLQIEFFKSFPGGHMGDGTLQAGRGRWFYGAERAARYSDTFSALELVERPNEPKAIDQEN